MGVFEPAGFLCEAAIAAARELGVLEALARRGGGGERGLAAGELAREIGVEDGHRLRALLEALAAIGAIARRGDGFAAVEGDGGGEAAGAGSGAGEGGVVRAGWGLLADVIRRDRPLAIEPADEVRYHRHLLAAGAAAARELAGMLGDELRGAGGELLDLGGGAGAYTAALLDEHAGARATLVDTEATVALAADHLARFGGRVRLVAGDARAAALGEGYAAALLANVLHLHGPDACAELCAVAARAVAPGGIVAVVDLRIDEGHGGPLAGVLFALNMAIYTDGGGVYEASRIRGWLERAGLVEIEERALAAAPEMIVVTGRRPRAAADSGQVTWVGYELDAAIAAAGAVAWHELERAGALRDEAGAAGPPLLALPASLRRVLARAIADERAEAARAVGEDGAAAAGRAEALLRHYTELMPRARVALLAGRAEPGAAFFHHRLDWARLPRLAAAIERLYALLGEAGADAAAATGAASAAAFRARTPTLAALYERTHYGGAMPLLYGAPADLAHFRARAEAAGLDLDGAIDRYFTAPIVHELCHFAADREALEPLHLDECIAGWLGVHVHPEFAYPAPGEDDAIFAAPWLAQIGQAIARAFGVRAVVRAHAGAARWADALPAPFVAAAARLGRDDWRARRTLHFLSDTLDPDPWVGLALAAGAGRPLAGETLASLARLPPAAFAALPDDPDFDRAIVADALRAMCLDNARVGGSFRARARLPDGPIVVDAAGGRISAARRGEVDTARPRYWIPPAVCARLAAAGADRRELRLGDLAAIPEAAAAICEGAAAPVERAGFAMA